MVPTSGPLLKHRKCQTTATTTVSNLPAAQSSSSMAWGQQSCAHSSFFFSLTYVFLILLTVVSIEKKIATDILLSIYLRFYIVLSG